MTQKPFFKYFPISESIRQWGFWIISAGHTRIEPGQPYPPVQHPQGHHFSWEKGRKLDSYTLVYIPQGSGLFESKPSGQVKIREGNLFIVYPGIWHRYRPDPQTGWEEYWIEFQGPCAKQFLGQDPFSPAAPVCEMRSKEPLFNVFAEILQVAHNEPYGFQYLLSGLAVNLLALILSDRGRTDSIDLQNMAKLDEAKKRLVQQAHENVDLRQLAADLHVSYSWLRKAFKDYTGFSLRQYQLEFRLHRARQLLSATNLRISEISDNLGFSSVYYFSQLFRKKTGTSPLLYRKKCR